MSFWKKGPREWSPRLARGLRLLRKLHDAVPRSMINPPGMILEIGTLALLKRQGREIPMKLAFFVQIPFADRSGILPVNDAVWISPEGILYVGSSIRKLLEGRIKGYEYLAGRARESMSIAASYGEWSPLQA